MALEIEPNPYTLQVNILRNAEEPPSDERELPRLELGGCSLTRGMLATEQQGGDSESHEIIVEEGSGRTWLFMRRIRKAIYGDVWYAIEVERTNNHYEARYDENGRTCKVAVKVMPWAIINDLRGRCVEDPLKEIQTLAIASSPGHEHVLRKEAALTDGTTVYLVTPFIDGGELFDWISEKGGVSDQAEMETVRCLFRQLVEGMKYTHSKGICHADMSLENALVDMERRNAYIIDYGMSLLMPVTLADDGQYRRLKSVRDGRKAKASYCSPEVYKKKDYDGVKVDVFAAGSMLFMMLTGTRPFAAATRNDRRFRTLVWERNAGRLIRENQRHLGLPPLVGDQAVDFARAVDLVQGMMAYHPGDRLLPEQILEHPWFNP